MKLLTAGLMATILIGTGVEKAEAQRFGDYYYTTQKTVNVRGQKRVCKMMGYNFARFDTRNTKIVKIDLPRTSQCRSTQAAFNGECCSVYYQDKMKTASR